MEMTYIHNIIKILRAEYLGWKTPAVSIIAECGGSPFKVLVSCIISLRTKDEVTAEVAARLFKQADTPEKMICLSDKTISELIYPAGFYRNKSVQIFEISKKLVNDYSCLVPNEIDDLLKFKGVGRKTANLVVTLGFGKPGICVDTHVHRIFNRWGCIATKKPDETESVLRSKLPQEYWLEINELLVAFGQNLCLPRSPRCTTCRLENICPKIGINK